MRFYLHLIFVPFAAAGCALFFSGASAQAQATAGLTLYTFGTPSGDETEILLLINRARANPPVDGQRLVNEMNALYPGGTSGIDLTQLLADFQSYPARPPLAFNAALNAAAQFHLPEMIAAGHYTHYSPNGDYFDVRDVAFGYQIPTGENVAGSATYPFNFLPYQIEDDYELDTNEPGYGHRLNIMEPFTLDAVEVGIAEQAFGGWNVEDFGSNYTPTLLMGVVFTDNAGTGLYVSGEGVGSVVVTAPGASSFYAVTVPSGAYTLPLDLLTFNPSVANPTVQVVFTDALGNDATTKAVALTRTVGPNGTTTYTNAQGQLTPIGGNVNLLWTPQDRGLHMIDHNLAFDDTDPDASMQNHVFHGLASRWTQEFRAQQSPLLRAAADEVDAFWAQMPEEWTDIPHHVTRARVEYLLWRYDEDPANFWRLP